MAHEVDAMDLGLFEIRTAVLIAFGPEADAAARSRSTCAAGTLVCRGATDPGQLPAVDAPFARHSGQCAPDQLSITVVTPSIVSEVSATFVLRMTLRRSLGLSARSWSSAGSDPCRGQYDGPGAAGRGRKPFLNAANLGHARQERPGCDRRRGDRSSSSSISGTSDSTLAGRSTGRYSSNYGMRSPFGPDDRAIVEKPRDRLGVERGRHDDQNQVGTNLAADFAQECQREVAVQVPLVKFVENDGADGFEEWVGQELAREDSLGQKAEPGVLRSPPFEVGPGSRPLRRGSSPVRRRSWPPRPARPRAGAGARSRLGVRPRAGRCGGWPAAPGSSCPNREAPPRPRSVDGGRRGSEEVPHRSEAQSFEAQNL